MKRLAPLLFAAACSSGYRADAPTTPAPQAAPPAQLRQIGLAPADGATSICPGAPFQVVVTGTATDGRTLATPTSYRGGAVWYEEHGLPWQRFQISSNVGSITPAAMFAPPPSIFTLAETSAVQLHAVDLANPQLVADLSMPVDFHCGQTLALRGQPGAAGANGSAGQQGGMGGQVQISVGRLNTHAHGAVIRVDASDRLLAQAVKVYNPGGPGGHGGVNGRGVGAVQAGGGPMGPAGPLPQISYEDPSQIFADEIAQGFPVAQPQVARRPSRR